MSAGLAIVTQAAVAAAVIGENAGCSRSYYPFPAVSQSLFFHQSIPVTVGVPGVTHSERMCKHYKRRKLTEKPSRDILQHSKMCLPSLPGSSAAFITPAQKLDQPFSLAGIHQ